MTDIISHYGIGNQIEKCQEELLELNEVITEAFDGHMDLEHFKEELADVMIMCQQMVIAFDLHEEIEEMIDFKLNRQVKRMESEEHE